MPTQESPLTMAEATGHDRLVQRLGQGHRNLVAVIGIAVDNPVPGQVETATHVGQGGDGSLGRHDALPKALRNGPGPTCGDVLPRK